MKISPEHTLSSAIERLCYLPRKIGIRQTLSSVFSFITDYYLRLFDLVNGTRTSGYIPIEKTSLRHARIFELGRYQPVHARALRKVLEKLELPRELSFVDLGCGLGRACLVAADYGFARVRGVEIVPEFCRQAEANASSFTAARNTGSTIEIINLDAVEYTRGTDDDIFFLYRPFDGETLSLVLDNIKTSSAERRKKIIIIYSERIGLKNVNLGVFEAKNIPGFHYDRRAGQDFFLYALAAP